MAQVGHSMPPALLSSSKRPGNCMPRHSACSTRAVDPDARGWCRLYAAGSGMSLQCQWSSRCKILNRGLNIQLVDINELRPVGDEVEAVFRLVAHQLLHDLRRQLAVFRVHLHLEKRAVGRVHGGPSRPGP
jgi:hypothetical protein